ncbi:MAG: DUF502 domain-containing protein [Planctomycetota bacterium]|nr:MAG: DUF502 domain-containing protein [Planctomycetota bacterium]
MGSNASARGILGTYRSVFLRGLATILPTLLTLWFLWACWGFVSNTVAAPIAGGIKSWLVETRLGNEVVFYVWDELAFLRKATPAEPPASLDPAERERLRRAEQERLEAAEPQRLADLRYEIDQRFPRWVGVVLAVVVCFVVGFFMASFVGAQLLRVLEAWLNRIPLINKIYPGAKQMVGFFLSGDDEHGFQAVVAVEFPRKGLWSVGFLTSENIPEIEAHAGERVRGVYLGTPAAGQVVLARESEIVAVDMTVDEALKFLMSGGVIGRDAERPPSRPRLPWEEAPPEAGGPAAPPEGAEGESPA